MKKIINSALLCAMFLLVGSFLNTKVIQAASAEVEISSDSTETTVGDKILVTIAIDSDTVFGDFEANLTYDDEIMEYQGGPSIITGGNGFLKIADTNVSEGDTNRKYVLEFEALEVGNSEISFSNRARVYDYEEGTEMSVSSNIYTLSVKAAVSASENALLKSLKISPSKLQPTFEKNTFSYNTIVEYDTEKLVVEALVEDENSIVKIKGNDSLKEGENKIIVTVIAESGAVIEYTIDAYREYAPEEEITEEPTITPGTKHGTFEVARIDGELFAVYSGKYKLIEPDSEVQIPIGFNKTRIMISDISIDVYAPEDDMGADFLLIYAENELGEAGFYQYDKIERTMQRYIADSALGFEEVTEPVSDNSAQLKEYKNSLTKAAVVISLLGILCAILVVILVRQYLKARGYRDDDLE